MRLLKRQSETPPAIEFVPPPEAWPGWPVGWSTAWDGGGLDSLALKSAVVFRCVDLTANSISSLPLGQFTPDQKPAPQPAAWMSNPQPGLYTSRREAICSIVVSLLLRGNAYLYVTAFYEDGYPRFWVILNPDAVSVSGDDAGMPVYRVNGSLVSSERLHHIRHQCRPGALTGMGPLEATFDNLYGMAQSQKWANELTGDGMIPTGLLTYPEQLSTEQSAELRDQWEATPGITRVLSGGLDFRTVGLSPKDILLLDRIDFDARCIATAFGIPAPMLNLSMEGAGLHYSSSEMDLRALWQLTLNPIADNVERALSEMLPGHQNVRFDEYGFLAGAFSEQVTAATQLVSSGIWTLNEARTKFNLPELPESEKPQQQPQQLQDQTQQPVQLEAVQ